MTPSTKPPRDREPAASAPFREFFHTEAAAGLLLVVCAAVALVVANSRLAPDYAHFWALPVSLTAGPHRFSLTLHQWVNDGLMAIFFLLVGLEIKREILAGELASIRQAALPIAGALGGMVMPALLYTAVAEPAAGHGWAIPMATDIAFALGVLALAAPNAPPGLKVFLAALAIVDDMGAVVVIAIFYSSAIVWTALAAAAAIVVALLALNAFGVRHLAPYLMLGLALWCAIHESGVHATIAGVLLALTIPTWTRIEAAEFSRRARTLLDDFDRTATCDLPVLTSKGQQDAIIGLERASENITAPLLRLEHALQRISAFVIMPLFAFSNAGVGLGTSTSGRTTLAVAIGLVAGKPLGIMLASMAAVRVRWATLPAGVSWKTLHGCAWLGGIGFTMSLFIATLAFDEIALVDAAKVGILSGSLAAGIVGALMTRSTVR